MVEDKDKEEKQKDYIFNIFSKCHTETASSRLQMYYPTLCAEIYKWYRDYLSIDVDKMGLEIARVINRFLKDKTISKIPEDKDSFFKYLTSSIKRESDSYYREYNEKDTIKIPKEKKQKLREVEDFIRMKESQLGRKITTDELIQSVSKWFKKQEYLDLLKVIDVDSITPISKNGNDKVDVLNNVASILDDPADEYIKKTDMETVRETVKSLIEKKQERSRDCYKALFTLYCIDNYKDFEMLYPVLDSQILETWKNNGDKPKQYEIYQQYHPNAQKPSAEAMASQNLREFLNDIENCLKEKN